MIYELFMTIGAVVAVGLPIAGYMRSFKKEVKGEIASFKKEVWDALVLLDGKSPALKTNSPASKKKSMTASPKLEKKPTTALPQWTKRSPI